CRRLDSRTLVQRRNMRAVLRDRRTGLPILAVFIGLVLTFAVPPLSRVVAAGSSSSASSMSSQSSQAQSCFSVVSLGSAAPGGKVSGTLAPSTQPGCAWVDGVTLSVNGDKRSGHTISKTPDANGQVSVSVAVKSQTQGVLDDPVDVTLQCGNNTVPTEGDTSEGVTSTADGDFTVECGTTTP